MFLKVKVTCTCGCSYSFTNDLTASPTMRCPNCSKYPREDTADALRNILVAARNIELCNGDPGSGFVKSIKFKCS